MTGVEEWGAARELTAFETLMWRAEADPLLRSSMVAVEVLDSVPDWDRLVAAHEWGSNVVPRLRDRVVEPLGGLGALVWETDLDFDLSYHLRRVRLAGDGGWAALFKVAEQFAVAPLDRHRPPWEALLVEGLPDDQAAYLLKVHHSVTDGLGLAQLFNQLHSRQREHNPDKPQRSLDIPSRPVGTREHLISEIRRDLGAVPTVLRGGQQLLKSLKSPGTAARDAVSYVESAYRVLAPPASEGSPILRGRSLRWRFAALDVGLADLKAAGKALGGSLNDAYLTALLGAFRLYHEEMGSPYAEDATMPLSVPVSIRKEGDTGGGNRFAPARLAAPVGEPEVKKRIDAVRELMLAARAEPALESADVFSPLVARLPGSVIGKLGGNLVKSSDLQASNLPGLREEVFLCGARIQRTYPFAPLPGCPAMITLVTHQQTCCVGANLDGAAITEPGLFSECLERGFTEVLAAYPKATPPVRLS